MAFATEKISSQVVKEDLERLRDDVVSELEELIRELGDGTEALVKEPSLHDDKDLDNMMKRKLLLESEIEATMETSLAFLPSDKRMLIRLAREEAESTALDNERTLNFYKQKQKELQIEKNTYEGMIDKAVKVDKKLDELLQDRSESALLDILRKRYEQTGILFRELRTVLHMILTEFYPEEVEGLSMENLLEVLVSKMLEDPSDPYVNIHEGMKDYHIAFLLRANLIMRHKNDVTRIRFVDPN